MPVFRYRICRYDLYDACTVYMMPVFRYRICGHKMTASNAKTFFLLLDLITFFDQCHVSSTSQALEVTKDTNSGVFVVPIDTSVSPSLLYCWLPASHPLCCTAGCQCLTLFVVLLAASVSSSLLYCWLPVPCVFHQSSFGGDKGHQ